MAVVDQDAARKVVVQPLDFEVVDMTVRTQASKEAITSWFVNRNTVHPRPRRNSSFLASCARRSRAQWLDPSTSTATMCSLDATSSL